MTLPLRRRAPVVFVVLALAGVVAGVVTVGGAAHRPRTAVAGRPPAPHRGGPRRPDRAIGVTTPPVPSSAGAAPVAATGGPYDPCPQEDGAVPGDGPSVATAVTIPAVPVTPLPGPAAQFDPQPGDVPATFAGTMVRPADTRTYPGRRPVVILSHGIYGDQCQMWWLAQYLAGVGYVTVTVTSPTPATHDASYGVAIVAAESTARFVAAPLLDPDWGVVDPSDLGIAGWSEGSVVASVAQGLPGMGAVRAIVALDDLRGSFLGDTGAPLTYCSPPIRAAVSPRVPALGFASDTACDVEPSVTSPAIKLSGFDRWRRDGLAAVELPLAGYSHYDYDVTGPKLVPVAQLTQAWFDRWLLDAPGALEPLLACRLGATSVPGALSSTFNSAVYLPALGIDSTTWARTLAARCGQDPASVGTTPFA